jgi:NAD(P) transhydrogenase subunit alpha
MTEGLIAGIVVFTLATFIGVEIINKIPPTLHTPLMSGSNAISGISLVGALLVAGDRNWSFAVVLGLIAVILSTINVVGGFLVTDRMLQMFKKKEAKA